jgi:hypothetical protein
VQRYYELGVMMELLVSMSLGDVTAWEFTDQLLAPYHMPVLAGGAEWIIYGFFS